MKRNANDKLMDLAKELADFLGESKYGLSFFYKGECLQLSSRLGEKQVGMNFNQQDSSEDLSLLCLKGGDNAPKAWKRFTTIDSPERPLTYICEEEAFDAITFIPKRDI